MPKDHLAMDGASKSRVEIERTGRVLVVIGGAPANSDAEAGIAQATAEALGVPLANVEVAFGGSDDSAEGVDSLQTTLGLASESLRTTAARMLRCQPDDVFLAENRAYSKIDFHAALDLEDVIRTTARTSGVTGPLVFEAP
jgi:CO/xanthine dehydrogenase Mo-binding subunit